MMKVQSTAKCVVAWLFLGLSLTKLYGQGDENKPIDLKAFNVPTTPAFTILNLGPQSITRPTTSKGVAASLLSAVDGNVLNPNVSLEITPFWLTPVNQTFNEYFELDNSKVTPQKRFEKLWQNLAISLATTKLGDNKDTLPGTRLGWGVRTKILEGELSEKSKKIFEDNNFQIDNADLIHVVLNESEVVTYADNTQSLEDMIEKIKSVVKNLNEAIYKKATPKNKEEIKNWIDREFEKIKGNGLKPKKALEYLDELAQDKKKPALEIQKLSNNLARVGWIWEIGIAGSQYFENNTIGNSVFNKAGLWSSITYRTETGKNEFTFLLRKIINDGDSLASNTDIGGSFNRIVSTDFYFGGEIVYRDQSYTYKTLDIDSKEISAQEKNTTWRFALKAAYKLNDDAELNLALGKDFDSPIRTSGNLLALIGLNYSLPTKQTLSR